jgi:hypothetical protein
MAGIGRDGEALRTALRSRRARSLNEAREQVSGASGSKRVGANASDLYPQPNPPQLFRLALVVLASYALLPGVA